MSIPTAIRRRAATVLLAASLALLAVGLVACGGSDDGGGGDEDATALLDRAFAEPIPSADVELDLQLEVDGVAGLEDPIRVVASGPYVRSKGTLPKLDMDLEILTQGAGQAFRTGLLSTGGRVFLRFADVYYEQPREQVRATNRRLARDGKGGDGGSLSDLGLDPRGWIADASIAGEEEVGGVQTQHVTGTLDVEAMVTDLNRLLETSADAVGAAGQAPEPLGEDDVERLARTVEDPSFDVYVGEDGVVRRLSTRLDLTVPEGERADVGGASAASIRFSAELADVGGDQAIEAPDSARPISELSRQLGGLAGLAGGLGGGVGGSGAADDGGSALGAGDADGGSSGASATEVFERYGQCLEQAPPDDAAALDQCTELLR